ncbi:helix-turn-helix domain-containing protein [Aestuariicella hydrocarbonica]|uniref:Helix-turn-helix domain-containing protein n=1 Tax=Pseudomaricurvus hydrocarbonicus TaxID=1470433 RepID=A0A9E5MM13_9GAMM|nr:helix-turn-helix domain-containing protein [Aestuariicella hydrocarbonica]
MPTKLSDIDNLPFTDPSRFEWDAGHYYIRRDNELELGEEAIYQFSSGILLRVLDLVSRTGEPVLAADPGKFLTFAFKLVGNNTLEMEDGAFYKLDEGCQLLAYHENSQTLKDTCNQGDDYVALLLMLKPEILSQSPFNLKMDELPSVIRQVRQGATSAGQVYGMSPELIQALRELLKGDRRDALNRAYLEAKTNEVLCLALRSILDQERQQRSSSISTREQQLMAEARKILQQRWQNPPALEELGQMLGVGKSRLTVCFKWLYGESIGGYVAHIRMQHAQQLLSHSTLNISQVAWEVGYEHPCNFVTAFKRQFGMTPKSFQKFMLERSA